MAKSDSFYNLETLGGILLFIAAVIAILIANSPLHGAYDHILQIKGEVAIGALHIKKPLLLWINDGLMAIYFMLIGLEIKREINRGVLSNKKELMVPVIRVDLQKRGKSELRSYIPHAGPRLLPYIMIFIEHKKSK